MLSAVERDFDVLISDALAKSAAQLGFAQAMVMVLRNGVLQPAFLLDESSCFPLPASLALLEQLSTSEIQDIRPGMIAAFDPWLAVNQWSQIYCGAFTVG